MENMKFRPVTEIVDGKPVRKWVPVDEAPEPECHQYGGYLKVKEEQIPETKEVLLEQLFDMLREIAKDDKFWIVKRASDFDNSILGRPAGFSDDDVTVGYKIDLPQMYAQQTVVPVMDYKQRMQVEYQQLKTRYEKLHKMCIKYEAGTLDFEPTCSLELLTKQKAAMGQYLHCLEVRAQIDGIEV